MAGQSVPEKLSHLSRLRERDVGGLVPTFSGRVGVFFVVCVTLLLRRFSLSRVVGVWGLFISPLVACLLGIPPRAYPLKVTHFWGAFPPPSFYVASFFLSFLSV
jgi:hypothetical protein